jgi:phi13 family phage major tail protein
MADNKIKYGLSNVHYALLTFNASNEPQFGTPVHIPGAVTMSMDAQGDNTPFYADNYEYYKTNGNNGYEGTIEFAAIPDSFRKDVLGDFADAKGVLFEDQDAPIKPFALLYEFEGDVKATRRSFLNCTASRPAEASQTKGENIEPQTESLNLSAKGLYIAAVDKYVVKGKTNASTDATTYTNWYSSVHTPAAS